jgi:HK97 gp10 family phage protein
MLLWTGWRGSGHVIANFARNEVPEKTGKLKASIRVVRLKGDPKQNIRVYAGSRKKEGSDKGAYYAHMVENGTATAAAHPFLRPALRRSKGEILGLMERGK